MLEIPYLYMSAQRIPVNMLLLLLLLLPICTHLMLCYDMHADYKFIHIYSEIILTLIPSTTEPATVTVTSSVLPEPERVTTTSTVTVTATPSPVIVTQIVTVTIGPPSPSPDPSGE